MAAIVAFERPGGAVASQAAVESSVRVRPIAPPATPLPPEADSAGVTGFSFIAYGDTRSSGDPLLPGDGRILQRDHAKLANLMVAKIASLSRTPHPVRFALQSGDAVLRGQTAEMWNVSFSPIIEKLTRGGGVPYFFAPGNHDVTTMPLGDRSRAMGLQNTLAAISRLIPPEGSPRRLDGYATYAFGYGQLFALVLDSNIAADPAQLAWATSQLEGLDRARYRVVIACFHHPPFSSGPHGGPRLEAQSAAIRDLYLPLFRRYRVRMTITGHDHLLDHFVEHYTADGSQYRRDDIVSGGGGAPTYVYTAEPDLSGYLATGAADRVRVEHLMRPGKTTEENPHHFLLVEVDDGRLSLEVVGIGPSVYAPYGGRTRIELTDRTSQ